MMHVNVEVTASKIFSFYALTIMAVGLFLRLLSGEQFIVGLLFVGGIIAGKQINDRLKEKKYEEPTA